MGCAHCGEEKVFARGYCQKHYWRLRRGGTLERRNAHNLGPCSQAGCERQAQAKGLCSKHYQQQVHPLRPTWKAIRSRYPGDYPPEWDGDFDAFLRAVGRRPPKHQLRRIDGRKPWAPGNFEWREPVGPTKPGAAAYQRAWSYLRKFGLREEDIEHMKAEQDGGCGVCGRPLERMDSDTQKPVRICVDHNHTTGTVRGLLCDPCNKGLGQFDDDIDRLRAAIAYLERHAEAPPPPE